ncbi:MAG: SDR family oxidoreductase [Bacteroidota bacterium]
MLQQFELINRTILVTGASSGIGKQIAVSISETGGTVFITGRDEVRLNETFLSLKGENHKFLMADLSVESEIYALVDKLPLLDGVVHSAGITSHFPAKFIGTKQIFETFNINLYAPVLLMKQVLSKKLLKDSASIVFLSSIASKYPYYGGSMYTASKLALEGYCRTLALELSAKKIRANCLAPAMVQTSMLEKTEETISKETLDKIQSVHPLGFGKPEDVANAAIFLLSDASRWMTGQNIILGGF